MWESWYAYEALAITLVMSHTRDEPLLRAMSFRLREGEKFDSVLDIVRRAEAKAGPRKAAQFGYVAGALRQVVVY